MGSCPCYLPRPDQRPSSQTGPWSILCCPTPPPHNSDLPYTSSEKLDAQGQGELSSQFLSYGGNRDKPGGDHPRGEAPRAHQSDGRNDQLSAGTCSHISSGMGTKVPNASTMPGRGGRGGGNRKTGSPCAPTEPWAQQHPKIRDRQPTTRFPQTKVSSLNLLCILPVSLTSQEADCVLPQGNLMDASLINLTEGRVTEANESAVQLWSAERDRYSPEGDREVRLE